MMDTMCEALPVMTIPSKPESRTGRLAAGSLGFLIAVVGCGRIGYDSIGAGDASSGSTILRVGEAPGTDLASVTFDNSLIDDNFGDNCGGCGNIYAGVGEVGLLRFDLSSLGALEVVSASIDLWLENDPTSSGTVQFYLVLEQWDEGGRRSQGPGVANWTERQPGVPWTSEGAGVGSRASLPFIELSPNPVGSVTELPLPLDAVQGWLNDPDSNFGILCVGRDYGGNGGDGHPHFVSSDGGPEDRRPVLVLGVR